MAILATRAVMEIREEDKTFHPFFERRIKPDESISLQNRIALEARAPECQSTTLHSHEKSLHECKPDSAGESSTITTPSVVNGVNGIESHILTEKHGELLDIDPNYASRKRQKSKSPEDAIFDGYCDSRKSAHVDSSIISKPDESATKSKKILRLNPKTGTIGSPPAKKAPKGNVGTSNKIVSGKTLKQSKSFVVTIKYGRGVEDRSKIGEHIACLLDGTKSFSNLSRKSHSSLNSAAAVALSKSTHPFFLNKIHTRAVTPNGASSDVNDAAIHAKRSIFKKSMTLGEARIHSPIKKGGARADISSFHNFGAAKILRYPGAVEPCWPSKGMVHVRGLDQRDTFPEFSLRQITLSSERKSKYPSLEILAKDDVLKASAAKLSIQDALRKLRDVDTERFAEPERCLRVPKKHFETGYQIQQRVRREISTFLPSKSTDTISSSSEDELLGGSSRPGLINSALLKVYDTIPGSLTAFDRSEYETQSWIQKYAPAAASDVLQCGKEAFILKDWLRALMVISVDTGVLENSRSRAGSVPSARPATSNVEISGKKKRKSDSLRGFVVSSDDEESDMDEISDPEDDSLLEESSRRPRKTVVRSGDPLVRNSQKTRKLKNAVVISGPSGCGKTAMVYGVAKELGFEVFEINASSRRTGKEVLERVGDMTRNHLVHHSQDCRSSIPLPDDMQHISDALNADLKSGRQGTMNSFFKTKSNSKEAKVSGPTKAGKRKEIEGDAPNIKTSQKHQKQSLILLEEVDILFEEDKQFWSTVMTLIAQSKRPIIMTCNDEALVPLHTMPLHAIIRLTPPPQDLATDYLLLVAAAEGHIVRRKAVKALYDARGHDLRASLTELDYWCQLGVGDCKGGLDWLYPRWPPGCDTDGQGRTIRTVSVGTYETGMGWIGRDFIFDRFNDPEVSEQVMRQAWDDWHVDFDDFHFTTDAVPAIDGVSREAQLAALSSYENSIEIMSAADVCAAGSLTVGDQTLLDNTFPAISARSRDDYVIGYELLEAEILNCFDPLDKKISTWLRLQARHLLQSKPFAKLTAYSETQVYKKIAEAGCGVDHSISRRDFSVAFDPIAEPEKNSLQSTSSLECSVFDRTISIISEDVAPYVRSIVLHDVKRQQERTRLSNLLSEGGRAGKRLRTTRSALSALEGGPRKTTRPEKHFKVPLNLHLVQRTGMQSWGDAVASERERTDMEAETVRSASENPASETAETC